MIVIRCETGDDVVVDGDTLVGADLSGRNLHRALLDGQMLRGADLSNTELRSAWLEGATLEGANLSRVSLAACNASRASFVSANLTEDTLHPVIPLGVFGLLWPVDEEPVRSALRPLVGMLPEAERPAIASYLRAGEMILAYMEGTSDVLGAFPKPRLEKLYTSVDILEIVGGAFAVSGGSAILTDGTYYWRLDTADYVEHYGVGLPEDFLRHGRSLGWSMPPMSPEDALAVDRYLMKHALPLRLSTEAPNKG
jgi:hypothetical protein